MKMVTRYSIYRTNDLSYSTQIGSKLYDRSCAAKIVKRLKRMGVDCFKTPMKINLKGG